MFQRRILMILPFLFCAVITFAQTRTITGKVVGAKNEAVSGASVSVKGTNLGAIAKEDGSFVIDNVRGATTLVVSSIGFNSTEIPVAANQNTITIVLTSAAGITSQPEVVVTSFGFNKAKRSLGYSVTQLSGDKFTESRTVNIGNALTGKVAGVNVTQPATGAAGSARVVIRGGASMLGNDQPLYVINGVPMESGNRGTAGMWGGNDAGDGLAIVNPDDVESISVLKGNAASALYGARAANGVILITTKSGRARKGIGVSFNSNVTMENVMDFTDFQNEFGPGQDGLKAANRDDALQIGQNAWGPRFDGQPSIQFDGQSRPYSHNNVRLKDFYRTGLTMTNSLAFSGGDKNTNYRFSVSDMQNNDIMPNANFRRQAFNFNINSNLGKRLQLAASGQYTKQKARNRPRLSDSPGNANFSVFMMPNNVPLSAIQGEADKPGALPNGNELQYQANVFQTNPFWAAYQFNRQDMTDRLLGNVSLKYNLTDWLYIQGRVGTDFQNRDNSSYTPYGTAFKPRGDFFTSAEYIREDNYDLFIGGNKAFGDFTVDYLVGGNMMRRTYERQGGGGNDLVVPFVHSVRNVAASALDYAFEQQGINSVFATANLGWRNYLFLNVSARQDRFSTLPASSSSLLYPSVGLSFIATDAFKLPEVISYAKFRVSYGEAGAGAPGPYILNTTYGLVGQGHLGANLAQINNGSIPNQSLVPSRSSEFEIGGDFRFFKNRLGLDIAYYNRNVKDEILATGISATSGFGSTFVNVGEFYNRGIELLLNVVPIESKNFSWQTSFNFAYNRSKVLDLGTNAAGQPIQFVNLDESRVRRERIRMVVGEQLGMIAGFKHLVNAKGEKVYTAEGFPVTTPGYENIALGRHPISAGWSNSFNYKNIRFSFLIDMRSGGNVMSGTNYFAYAYGLHKNTLQGRDGSLTFTGALADGTSRTFTVTPQNIDNYWARYAQVTENVVYDASFAKLRELSLGYTLNPSILKKTPIESLSISLVARNVALLWSNVPNIDPEAAYSTAASAQGLEFFGMPQPRSFGVNLSVNF